MKKGTTDVELIIVFKEVEKVETYAEFFEDADGYNDTEAIRDMILVYNNHISQGDFTTAYQLFSSSRKFMITNDSWTKGLQQNIKDAVTDLEIVTDRRFIYKSL